MAWVDSELSLLLAKRQIREWVEEAARIRAAEAATSSGREASLALDTLGRHRSAVPAWLLTLFFWSSR